MRYFQEVEIASVCYVREVASWITLGLVPSFEADENGNEIRGNPDAFFKEFRVQPDALTPQEVSHFGTGLSYDEYLALAFGVGEPESDETLPKITPEEMNTEEGYTRWKAEREAREDEASETLRRKLRIFYHETDRAQARIMAAIVEGKLSMVGFWAENEDAFSDSYYEGTLNEEPIPSELVSPALFDWESDFLETHPNDFRPAGGFRLITINTRAMLGFFDPPPGEALTVRTSFGNALAESSLETPQAAGQIKKRGRGRPPKADWLGDGMRARYQTQRACGNLGGKGRTESDLVACQQWASDVGYTVARTTVQTYLQGLLGDF